MSTEPSPSRFRRDREPPTRWLPAHQKRAGLGVWTAGRSAQARAAIKAWKRTAPFDPTRLAEFAAVADPVRACVDFSPRPLAVTTPRAKYRAKARDGAAGRRSDRGRWTAKSPLIWEIPVD
jgi:hypothetical protein